MTDFDREQFTTQKQLTAVSVPVKLCNPVVKCLKRFLFSCPRLKPVIADPDGDTSKRTVLLRESIASLSALPPDVIEFVKNKGVTPTKHTVTVKYESLGASEVLKQLLKLPPDEDPPSAFETIGHIAHLNLPEELMPQRHVIGTVLLEKNTPRIRTVVTKLGSIHNVFRTFDMERIAGDDDYEVEVSESGARFQFDFREVYWNSRLQGEHKAMIDAMVPRDIVCDMFAGVGPFSVPLAKRGVEVWANDLNPRSYHYLKHNARLNKAHRKLRAFNMDARAFVRHLLCHETPAAAEESKAAPTSGDGDGDGDGDGQEVFVVPPRRTSPVMFTQVMMNLPASAELFLDAFVGAFDRSAWEGRLPTVHCYCFSKAEDLEADVKKRCEAVLGASLDGPDVSLRIARVRDVAPKKIMMRVSFRVPAAAAFADSSSSSGGGGGGDGSDAALAGGGCGKRKRDVESAAAVNSGCTKK